MMGPVTKASYRVDSTVEEAGWSQIIKSRRGWLDFNLRELIAYRDLVWMFIKRDFVTVYKQTILGPMWYVLNPLFNTIVYTFIFGGLAKIPTDGVPQPLFYYGGSMLWNYFTACMNGSADALTGNASLFGKVYFPRLAVPVSKVLSSLVTAAIQFMTLAFFYVYYVATGATVRPTFLALAVPLLFMQLAVLGTGLGLIVSALTTRYRDLRQLVSFGLGLWMYATPIVYPLSQVPTKYRWIMLANPVSAPVEIFRVAMYGVGGVGPGILLASLISTVVLLFLGLVLFSRSEQNFVDVV